MILPDLLYPGVRVVFCGTAAGTTSAKRRTYYAGPGNRFWAVLHEVGLTNRLLRPDEWENLRTFNIGLTDLAKHVYGLDSEIRTKDFDREGLMEKISRCQPSIVAFNGITAASKFLKVPTIPYGPRSVIAGFPRVFVLPSTSNAGRRWWSIEPWRELAIEVSRI